MPQSRKIRSERKCSKEIQDTIKSSTHKIEKLLPNCARRNNGYGWKKRMSLIPNSATDIHQLGHNNICGHTTKLNTPMYFN
jgi:hypothetical protein